MMLSLEGAALRVRDRYLAYFRACLADLEEKGRVEPECEALDERGEVAVDGPLGLAYRHDAAVIAEGGAQIFMFESTSLESFEPFSQALGGLRVDVRPFHWDYCEVLVEPAITMDRLRPFAEWFRRWFRAHAEPVDGVVAAVHFASDPDVRSEATRIVLDLGTAPVEALFDLLAVLGDCGAQRLSIAPAELRAAP